MDNFKKLGISADLIKGLKELNIIKPTDIQVQAIPALMTGTKELIAQAQTGTGKTASYGLPLLEQVDSKKDSVQGLILCPTRELSQQVAKQLFRFTKYTEKVFTEAVYGGEKIDRQLKRLDRTTHIIVATPGRLIDLVKRKAIDLSQVETVILDEADEMLSMGFKKELEEILDFIPNAQKRWLFSATMPKGIQEIIAQYMGVDALRIQASKGSIVNDKITHKYLVCDEEEKLYVLIQYLKSEGKNRGLVFCKTRNATKTLTKQLNAKNIATDCIHGDLLQKERDKVMRAFKNETIQFMVATDIAARGIDIDDLSFVAHYQLPESREYYTHRSGRTARAGNKGVSLCIVTHSDVKTIRDYEKSLGIKFERVKQVR